MLTSSTEETKAVQETKNLHPEPEQETKNVIPKLAQDTKKCELTTQDLYSLIFSITAE